MAISITGNAKSLLKTTFMPAGAILFAIALFFTAASLSGSLAVKELKKNQDDEDDSKEQLRNAESIYGLYIAAAVTAWIAYVALVVGGALVGKKIKM